MEALQIFLLGWVVLIGAIGLNAAAGKFGLTSWYDFLTRKTTRPNLASLIWLLIVYPLGLGIFCWLGLKLLQL